MDPDGFTFCACEAPMFAHQAVASTCGCARVERPSQETLQLEIHGRGHIDEQVSNGSAEQFAASCSAPLQKAGARVLGKQTASWQSLGKGARRPRRPRFAEKELVHIADDSVAILFRRFEMAKLFSNDVHFEAPGKNHTTTHIYNVW